MARVIGITGGIATGKSTVLAIFAELGAVTVSADDIARKVLARNTPAYEEVVERFGEGVLTPDHDIDRAALASIIFANPDARQILNDITHPHIIAEIRREIEQFRKYPPSPDAILCVEIPLLIECGLEKIVDEVLLVAAEHGTQVSRLTSRSGISSEEALRRIDAQMPLDRKIERADRVIWNNGSRDSLRSSVQAVWDEIRLL